MKTKMMITLAVASTLLMACSHMGMKKEDKMMQEEKMMKKDGMMKDDTMMDKEKGMMK